MRSFLVPHARLTDIQASFLLQKEVPPPAMKHWEKVDIDGKGSFCTPQAGAIAASWFSAPSGESPLTVGCAKTSKRESSNA